MSSVNEGKPWGHLCPVLLGNSCDCRDVGKVEEGLGEKQGLLLQWMATLVAGVIVSLYTEWRLTLLIAFAGLLIAASTALLSVVRILSLMGVPLL